MTQKRTPRIGRFPRTHAIVLFTMTKMEKMTIRDATKFTKDKTTRRASELLRRLLDRGFVYRVVDEQSKLYLYSITDLGREALAHYISRQNGDDPLPHPPLEKSVLDTSIALPRSIDISINYVPPKNFYYRNTGLKHIKSMGWL